jgi:hypothetical protein
MLKRWSRVRSSWSRSGSFNGTPRPGVARELPFKSHCKGAGGSPMGCALHLHGMRYQTMRGLCGTRLGLAGWSGGGGGGGKTPGGVPPPLPWPGPVRAAGPRPTSGENGVAAGRAAGFGAPLLGQSLRPGCPLFYSRPAPGQPAVFFLPRGAEEAGVPLGSTVC